MKLYIYKTILLYIENVDYKIHCTAQEYNYNYTVDEREYVRGGKCRV